MSLRYSIIIVFLGFFCRLTAQTNTFPSSGNVGIGTTSPSYGLDVIGPSNSYTMRLGTPADGDTILSMTGDGEQLFSIRTASNGYVSVNTQNSAMLGLGVSMAGSPGTVTNTLNLTANGNVGIGTTSPNSNLSFGLSGTVSTADTIRLYDDGGSNWYAIGVDSINSALRLTAGVTGYISFFTGMSGGTEKVRISAAGNVGIGTTSPAKALDVAASANEDGIRISGAYPNTSLILNATGSSGNAWDISSTGGGHSYGDGKLLIGIGFSPKIAIDGAGNVGIGTTAPDQALSVNGTIHTKEVIVDSSGWPDYVFDSGYQLKPLSAVEKAIATDKHLPGMPSAKEVAAHGVKMGEMQAKLLAQLEEVTLRLIEEDKRQSTAEKRQTEEESFLQVQSQRIDHLEKENETLKAALAAANTL